MDLKKATTGELVAGGAGVLLLIFSFFKWYGVDIGGVTLPNGTTVGGGSVSRNGWQSPDSFFSIVAVLIGIAVAAYVVAKLAGADLPAKLGNLGFGLLIFILGDVAFLFVLIKWLSNTDFTKFGLYAGLICSAGLGVGGFLIAKERGELPGAAGGATPRPPAA